KALRLLEASESSFAAAKKILADLNPDFVPAEKPKDDAKAYSEGEHQIIEGEFDGQSMVGPSGRIFPVPAKYVSKSKLVEGDKLKLTILSNGTFLYKQIEPVDRRTLKGTLIKEDGQYKVNTPEGNYRVILAAVTYFKGKVGDEVTIIIPEKKESSWAAIEAIIPQLDSNNSDVESLF
ncbi:MAG: hypothetical protein AAB802_01960, partial [Patescibacteria group bacterium]